MAARGSTARDQAISAYLQGLVDRYGLNVMKLSERTGIPYASFRRYLIGVRAMGASDFLATLQVLDTSYSIAPEAAIAEIEGIAQALTCE